MDIPEHPADDVFLPSGRLREEILTEPTVQAFHEASRFTRETRWESIRSPHVFMGLLASPDTSIRNWGDRIGADLAQLLDQFHELFLQETSCETYIGLTREFFSDNVIRILRDAYERARMCGRRRVSMMDLMICLFTARNSIVGECFEQVGYTAAKLTELAVMAENHCRQA